MTRHEFERALLTHGSDLGRWPLDARRSAEPLVADDPRARKALEELVALEAGIIVAATPPPNAALTGRIIAAAQAETGAFNLTGRRIAAMLAACLGCVGIGYAAASVAIGLAAPAGLAIGLADVYGVM